MGDSFFTFLSSATIKLLTTNSAFFEADGRLIYSGLSVLVLMYVGLCFMFPGQFGPVHLGSVILKLVVTALMLRYYSAPIPGVGIGLHNILTEEARSLSEKLEGGADQAVQLRLNKVYVQLEEPGWRMKDVGGWLYYFVAIVLIGMMRFALVAVIGVGYIAVALCVLTGPLFIPWRIFPGTAWLFQSWLRSFIGFAYYQVAASAVVFICSTYLIAFFDQNPGPYTLSRLAVMLLEMATFLMSSVFAIILIPSLAASKISGKSGESGFRI